MFALINENDLTLNRITDGGALVWRGKTYMNIGLVPAASRHAEFIYDFIPAGAVPPDHNAGAASYTLNHEIHTVTETVAAIPWGAAKLAELKAAFIKRVDAEADQIIEAVVGAREGEYRDAEQDATVFAAANYTGTVPRSVACVATGYGLSAPAATTLILDTAATWREAAIALRENRIGSKGAGNAATDLAALRAAETNWDTFAAALKTQLGIT